MPPESVHPQFLGRPELGNVDLCGVVADLITATRLGLDRNDDDPVAAHNSYTHYVTLLLLSTTGHRPVRDPFCRRADIAIDSRCALIEDKVVSERHRYRLAWLCDTACRQIQAYDTHRLHLGQRLLQQGSSEARILGQRLISEARDSLHAVPYLFYLTERFSTKSVRPGRLAEAVAGLWSLPLNVGRYAIATRLRAYGVPEALISLQINHLHESYHPIGPSSLLCPATCGATLGAALEELAQEQGWAVLEGVSARDPSQLQAPVRALQSGPLHESRLFGPELRALERRRRRDEDVACVREVLATVDPASVTEEQAPQIVESLRGELMRRSAGKVERIARRSTLLWRHLRQHGGHALRRHLPGRVVVLEPEPSPIGAGHLQAMQAARRFADCFARHLAAAGDARTAVDPAMRIAELCVLAAFWGGVNQPERLQGLAEALPQHIYATQRLVWVEVPRADSTRPLWRWFPDALGQAFLQGLRRAMKARKRRPAQTRVSQILQNWLVQWAIVNDTSPFPRLCTLAGALWTHDAPATAAHLASGQIASQPLPMTALVRMLSGARLRTSAEHDAVEQVPEAIPWMPPVDLKAAANRSDFLQRFHRILQAAGDAPALGHQRRAGAVRSRLAHDLRALGSSPWPPIAALLIAWGVHLCEQGTRRKAALAGSTPVTYLRTVLAPLVESAWHENPMLMSDRELAGLYERAMSYATHGDGGWYLAGRLEEFHLFAAGELGLAPLDVSTFVPAGSPRRQRIADANLLLPWEYARAVRLLAEDDGADDASRQFAVAMLVLGYRFGLRIGEVADLLAGDLCVVDDQLCYVSVHASVFGDRKSTHATRCVPLIGTLSAVEDDTLSRMILRGRMLHAHDANAPLFALNAGMRDRADLQALQKRVHLALRQVTGEPSLRFHHLRHAFANRVFVSLMGAEGGEAWQRIHAQLAFADVPAEALRTALTGSPALETMTLHALATLVGHADLRTTFAHYIHVTDAWIPGSHRLTPLG